MNYAEHEVFWNQVVERYAVKLSGEFIPRVHHNVIKDLKALCLEHHKELEPLLVRVRMKQIGT